MTEFAPTDYEYQGKYLTSLVLEIFTLKKERPPIFEFSEDTSCPAHAKKFYCNVKLWWNGEEIEVTSIAAGNKKMAKHFASGGILNRLGFTREWLGTNISKIDGAEMPWPQGQGPANNPVSPVRGQSPNTTSTGSSGYSSTSNSPETISGTTTGIINRWNFRLDHNYIETLNNCCDEASEQLSNPEFTEGEKEGPPHNPTFTMYCSIYKANPNSETPDPRDKITVSATEQDKKVVVKKMAALEMLKKLVTLYGQNSFPSLSDWPPYQAPGLPRPVPLTELRSVTHQLNRLSLQVNVNQLISQEPVVSGSPDLLINQHFKITNIIKTSSTLCGIKNGTIQFNEENILDLMKQVSKELKAPSMIEYRNIFATLNYPPENGTSRLVTVYLNCKIPSQQELTFLGIGTSSDHAKCQAAGKLLGYFMDFL